MPTDTRFTAALATEQDARGIPTMAQIAALCGHKPLTATDTAPPTPEARKMDSSANTHRPNDAERCAATIATPGLNFYRGRRCSRAAVSGGYCRIHSREHREAKDRERAEKFNARMKKTAKSYARAEAASAIVKAARAFVGAQDLYSNTYAPLEKAVAAYEQLIGASE